MLRLTINYLLFLCFGGMLFLLIQDQHSTRKREIDKSSSQQAINSSSNQADVQTLDGYYLGASKDKFGQRAWFLRLDAKKKSGFLYLPPGLRKLSTVTLEGTGQISFRTVGAVGETVYSFSGQLNQNGFNGTLQASRLLQGAAESLDRTDIVFQKLDTNSLIASQQRKLYGLYSDVEYHQDGGDLVGADLILIPSSEGLQGIFTSYDDGMIPHTLLALKNNGNKLEFEIETQEGKEHYSGYISSAVIKLRRDDAQANPKALPWTLLKKKTVLGIFSTNR